MNILICWNFQVAEPKKAVVDIEVAKAEAAAQAANAIKQECEDALAEAVPVLESALSALDTIKPADIKLVQSFKNPPGAIKLVMEAVCVLLDVKPSRYCSFSTFLCMYKKLMLPPLDFLSSEILRIVSHIDVWQGE